MNCIKDLGKPIIKLSYTLNQSKQVAICVCHEHSIKLLNLNIGGSLHLLQEVNVFKPDQGLKISDCLLPPKMGGELLVATTDQNYFRVNQHGDFNAKLIGL